MSSRSKGHFPGQGSITVSKLPFNLVFPRYLLEHKQIAIICYNLSSQVLETKNKKNILFCKFLFIAVIDRNSTAEDPLTASTEPYPDVTAVSATTETD